MNFIFLSTLKNISSGTDDKGIRAGTASGQEQTSTSARGFLYTGTAFIDTAAPARRVSSPASSHAATRGASSVPRSRLFGDGPPRGAPALPTPGRARAASGQPQAAPLRRCPSSSSVTNRKKEGLKRGCSSPRIFLKSSSALHRWGKLPRKSSFVSLSARVSGDCSTGKRILCSW